MPYCEICGLYLGECDDSGTSTLNKGGKQRFNEGYRGTETDYWKCPRCSLYFCHRHVREFCPNCKAKAGRPSGEIETEEGN